jgi:hypothetical protein
MLFGLFKRKSKEIVKAPVEETPKSFLDDFDNPDLSYLDQETHEPFVINKNVPKRKTIDLALFTKIQRALALKNARKFYRTDAQIASRFKIGTTTVSLIRRATEAKKTLEAQFKHYKELRQLHSTKSNKES